MTFIWTELETVAQVVDSSRKNYPNISEKEAAIQSNIAVHASTLACKFHVQYLKEEVAKLRSRSPRPRRS